LILVLPIPDTAKFYRTEFERDRPVFNGSPRLRVSNGNDVGKWQLLCRQQSSPFARKKKYVRTKHNAEIRDLVIVMHTISCIVMRLSILVIFTQITCAVVNRCAVTMELVSAKPEARRTGYLDGCDLREERRRGSDDDAGCDVLLKVSCRPDTSAACALLGDARRADSD